MKKTILVVEDQPEIAEVLRIYLESEGYNVIHADDGEVGLQYAKENNISHMIVDLMIPSLDGYQLIKEVREFTDIPIMIVSAKNEDHNKILGLNLGADDYLTKPFNPLELTARVNASIRRYYNMSSGGANQSKIIHFGDLKLNMSTCTLMKNNEEINLTATEYKILTFLIQSPNRIYSKVQINQHIYGEYYEISDNAIIVHVCHLRDKLGLNPAGVNYIKTVRGLGYKIEKN